MLSVCPGRDKERRLKLRVSTYDLAAEKGHHVYLEEDFPYGDFEGQWLGFFVAHSKAQNALVAFVRLEYRQILLTIPAAHFKTTEKLEFLLGPDGYLPALQGSFFDVQFRWGPDGLFLADQAPIEELLGAQPTLYNYPGARVEQKITDEWRFDATAD